MFKMDFFNIRLRVWLYSTVIALKGIKGNRMIKTKNWILDYFFNSFQQKLLQMTIKELRCHRFS